MKFRNITPYWMFLSCLVVCGVLLMLVSCANKDEFRTVESSISTDIQTGEEIGEEEPGDPPDDKGNGKSKNPNKNDCEKEEGVVIGDGSILSVEILRRHGEEVTPSILVKNIDLSSVDPSQDEAIGAITFDLQTYKEHFETGWGNLEALIAICDDSNSNEKCSDEAKYYPQVIIHLPMFVSDRYPKEVFVNLVSGNAQTHNQSQHKNQCRHREGPMKIHLDGGQKEDNAQVNQHFHAKMNIIIRINN